MKNILLIFLLSFTTTFCFAQQKFSHADSLILTRIDTLGPFTGTYYIDRSGKQVPYGAAPQWTTEVLIDSFAEKSLDVKRVFDFIKANTRLLYQYFGYQDLYFLAITDKEVIGIKVADGKPEIDFRTKLGIPASWVAPIYFIKTAP